MTSTISSSSKQSWQNLFFEFVREYRSDLPTVCDIDIELELWHKYWTTKHVRVVPSTVSQTLLMTELMKLTFPCMMTVLRILGTLPVTTCSCERSISSLRRLKMYLHSTMTQERLNSLALLHVHNYMALDLEKIINSFARKHPHRMNMINILETDKD